MAFLKALMILTLAGLIVGGMVLLLRKKKLPLPPLPIKRARKPELTPQERAAELELAGRAVSTYPELGPTPAGLLAELEAYCKKAGSTLDNTPRVILEKLLLAGSLQKAMSYWQVHAFLDFRKDIKGNPEK